MHRSEIRAEKKYEDKQRLRGQKFANAVSDSQGSAASRSKTGPYFKISVLLGYLLCSGLRIYVESLIAHKLNQYTQCRCLIREEGFCRISEHLLKCNKLKYLHVFIINHLKNIDITSFPGSLLLRRETLGMRLLLTVIGQVFWGNPRNPGSFS